MTREPADVTALSLQDAREVLERARWQIVRVLHTAPPRGSEPQGELRVVRQGVVAPGEVELVVAWFPVAPSGSADAP